MNLIQDTQFVLIGKEGSENLKRIKRKLNKQKIFHLFRQKFIKQNERRAQNTRDDNINNHSNSNIQNLQENNTITDQTPYEKLLQRYEKQKDQRNKKYMDMLDLLREHLIEIKKTKTVHAGVLTDDNVLTHSVKQIPECVKGPWDILFLQYNVKNYIFDKESSSVYWCRVNVLDSRHFIINKDSIDNILEILKQCNTWIDFINKTWDLNCYGITQSFISENSNNYLYFPYDKWNSKKTSEDEKQTILYNYSKCGYQQLQGLDIQILDWNKCINFFDQKMLNVNPENRYLIYPKISVVCLVTDVKLFIHTLHTFLKLDYPKDKLELVVVDDMDIDKKLKGIIPNDNRIRFINIKNKDSKLIPLGYKLNIGAKYANNGLIYHLFDNNVYFPNNFRNLVKCYLLSKKDIIISDNVLEHDKSKDTSSKVNIFNIANMLYSKNYWLVHMFKDIDDPNMILYNFLSFRTNTIVKVPSIYISFKLSQTCNKNQNNVYSESETLDINLEDLIQNDIKESYDLMWS